MNDKTGGILFVGDLHLGARNSAQEFVDEFVDWWDRVLIKTIAVVKPKAIVFVGDIFDDRVKINVLIMNLAKEKFTEINELGIQTFVIIGNHDTFLRSSVRPNSVEPLLREFQNVHVIAEPTDLKIGELNLLMIPWICKTNEDEVWTSIEATSAEYLVGHLELIGFETSPGVLANHGDDPSDLNKFKMVISGHYHTWSKKNNVLYVGTPYQLTRSDVGQLKRLWILNEDKTIDFVENQRTLFTSVRLDSKGADGHEVHDWFGANDVGGLFVTVLVDDGVDDDTLRKFVEDLERFGAKNVKVVDSRVAESQASTSENVVDVANLGLKTLILQHIELEPDLAKFDRQVLKTYAEEVMQEIGM